MEQEFSFSAWDVFLMYSMMARIVWITATRNDPNAIEPVGWGGEEEGERGERMHAREWGDREIQRERTEIRGQRQRQTATETESRRE